MDYISFDDLQKVNLQVGTVISVTTVPKSDKLLNLQVDFGEVEMLVIDSATQIATDQIISKKYRTVLAGIGKSFTFDQLVGKQFLFVTNLAPRKMMGVMSEAMILAVGESAESLSIFSPTGVVTPGIFAK